MRLANLFLAAVPLVPMGCQSSEPPAPPERPNILLISTDQQRTDTLGCYGSDFMKTPVIDKLASGGVRFDRAYCNRPL